MSSFKRFLAFLLIICFVQNQAIYAYEKEEPNEIPRWIAGSVITVITVLDYAYVGVWDAETPKRLDTALGNPATLKEIKSPLMDIICGAVFATVVIGWALPALAPAAGAAIFASYPAILGVRFYDLKKVVLFEAERNLQTYLSWSPEQQYESLTNSSNLLTDLAPALLINGSSFVSFFASKGFELLSPSQVEEFLMRSNPEGDTIFGLLPHSQKILSQNFVSVLGPQTKLLIIYKAGPINFHVKKLSFVATDTLLKLYLLNTFAGLKPLDFVMYPLGDARVLNQLTHLPKLPPEMIGEIASWVPQTFAWSPERVLLSASFIYDQLVSEHADKAILKSYGKGVSGFVLEIAKSLPDTLK